MQRKKKKEGIGFYIAICCAILVVAASGFVSRLSMEDESDTKNQGGLVVMPQVTPEEVSEPSATEEDELIRANNNVIVEENIEFSAPVSGNVIAEFSGEDLIYNESLKDWRAHSGVDFSAQMGEKVLACANGVVESVYDSNMGRCVVVDHKNGYKTTYANLEENTGVKPGDEICAGDVLGMVGDTALGDITEEAHLHFEVTKDGENINPMELFK